MKKIKIFLIGLLAGCMLMTATPALANSITQKIDVIFNSVQVQVNGEKIDASTILYDGSTYLPMRKVVEAVGKDVEWNQETKTANIVEKTKDDAIIEPKEGDTVNDEFKIIKKENDIPIIAEKNGETYYTINYTLQLMQAYDEYTFDNKNGNISFVLFKDETVLLSNVSYTLDKGIIYISKAYYENTILPLIKK